MDRWSTIFDSLTNAINNWLLISATRLNSKCTVVFYVIYILHTVCMHFIIYTVSCNSNLVPTTTTTTTTTTVTHTYTTVLWPAWILSATNQVSRHQKRKTNLDLLEQDIVSGSSISWAICKSAPWPRHITTPASQQNTQFFTGRMPFLLPNQQCHSTTTLLQKYLLTNFVPFNFKALHSMSHTSFNNPVQHNNHHACTHARTHTQNCFMALLDFVQKYLGEPA